MKRFWSALAAVSWLCAALPAAAPAAPSPRQSGPAIAVGAAVVDDSGNPVGNIVSLQGDDVIVRTDRHEARIPRSSLWSSRGRLILSMTRAQLNAAIDRLAPAPPVEIAAGVVVRGAGGAVAGTIEAVQQDHVILRLNTGERASLPRSAVGTNAEGAVISITAEELQRMVDQAAPATTSLTATTPAE